MPRRCTAGHTGVKNIHHLAQTEQQHLAKALNMEGCAFRLILISDFALLTLIQEQRICSELYYLFLHTQFELLPLKNAPAIFCLSSAIMCIKVAPD